MFWNDNCYYYVSQYCFSIKNMIYVCDWVGKNTVMIMHHKSEQHSKWIIAYP